ncbi:salivaricin M family lantibiotic [Anaeromicropila herbilytica]|uniref:Plantaricin C family lantibiotic n=1 Tax=Anaeromicropila herbilytica TaxID=2785025 RepID=A0A7R7IBS1_9FIRM|nr:salivaricin M family lantibiotic [Anaeromicropila herbilytica]BCN29887.1 hypothetical protein bsdtb5_11820 [Anaeromicropila herbilytica]
MSKEKDVKPIDSVVEEIKGQDLDEKAGAGISTAIQMTLAGRCGAVPTLSYECSSDHKRCDR